jgi:hypothetical protein
MGLRVKHVVIGLSVLGLGVIYVNERVKKLSEIMVKLIPIPSGLRNWSFKNLVLYFNFDLTIHNPTNEDFNPNGIIVTVKRVEIKDNTGNLIAKVNINKNSVNIPAGGKYILKDLALEIDAYSNVLNAVNLVKIRSLKDIKTDIVISILGVEHIIPQL